LATHFASAQSGPDLDGKWEAKFVAATGRPSGADVAIKGSEGTWHSYSAPRSNPCLGKETPIAIERGSAETIVVKLLYSKLLVGCQDGQFSVKLEGAALKGQFSDGRALELVRK
jgi:hypothetical protein